MMNSDILAAVAQSRIDDRVRQASARPVARPFWKRNRRGGGGTPAAAPLAAPATGASAEARPAPAPVSADTTDVRRDERVLAAHR